MSQRLRNPLTQVGRPRRRGRGGLDGTGFCVGDPELVCLTQPARGTRISNQACNHRCKSSASQSGALTTSASWASR